MKKKVLTSSDVVIFIAVLLLLLSPCRPRQTGARSTDSGHRRDSGATLQWWRRRRSSTGHRCRCRCRRCYCRGRGSRGSYDYRRGRRGRGRGLGSPGDATVGWHSTVLAMPRPTVPAALAVIIVRRVQALAAVSTWVRCTMIPIDLSKQ